MEKFLDTYSGKRINFWGKIESREIDIEDIIHALSAIGRFAGHAPRHYSVAEHSILVASLVESEHQLAALLHDASEAYTGDLISPIKTEVGRYRQLEKRLTAKIDEKFGVDSHVEEVKRADMLALYMEARHFYGEDRIADWGWNEDISVEAKELLDTHSIASFSQTLDATKRKYRSSLIRAGMNIRAVA